MKLYLFSPLPNEQTEIVLELDYWLINTNQISKSCVTLFRVCHQEGTHKISRNIMMPLTGETLDHWWLFLESMIKISLELELSFWPSSPCSSCLLHFHFLFVIVLKLSRNMREQSYLDLEDWRKEEPQVLAYFSFCPALTSTLVWISELSLMKFHLKKCCQGILLLSVWMLYASIKWVD